MHESFSFDMNLNLLMKGNLRWRIGERPVQLGLDGSAKFSKFVSWNVKIQRFHGLARMPIDMGLTTDLLLSNYNPIDISFKQFISGASN